MLDLMIHAAINCNLPGIARFYETIFQAPIVELTNNNCVVSAGPKQTLTFVESEGITPESHVDLRDKKVENELADQGNPFFLSNYGPHISMCIA